MAAAVQRSFPIQSITVIDGDTVKVDVIVKAVLYMPTGPLDLQAGPVTFTVRIVGIQSPELSTLEGRDARTFAATVVLNAKALSLLTFGKRDKYGRLLGDIEARVDESKANLLSNLMLEAGHAIVAPWKEDSEYCDN